MCTFRPLLSFIGLILIPLCSICIYCFFHHKLDQITSTIFVTIISAILSSSIVASIFILYFVRRIYKYGHITIAKRVVYQVPDTQSTSIAQRIWNKIRCGIKGKRWNIIRCDFEIDQTISTMQQLGESTLPKEIINVCLQFGIIIVSGPFHCYATTLTKPIYPEIDDISKKANEQRYRIKYDPKYPWNNYILMDQKLHCYQQYFLCTMVTLQIGFIVWMLLEFCIEYGHEINDVSMLMEVLVIICVMMLFGLIVSGCMLSLYQSRSVFAPIKAKFQSEQDAKIRTVFRF